ncbi:adenine nucleotide alpha hydrolase [Mesorhizobium australafricanum]|uniref:Adenine nucleotide alpha hydrolase n=1 Tax=Mesorhizobium australafricanum TaxID=3072311 RepID=A0ABU4WZA5_9HYPH|nr:adenine nucleotide alpha hydrolase [Mesorhizobium sp. VK3E]MDX8441386.1 adenine nucleotide alpha hydrolase [Mesorhizobium sp. VK3E]
MTTIEAFLGRLDAVFDSARPAAVAISGGVDSMTLAFVAHLRLGADLTMFHAASAAVPVSATERVRDYAARHGWNLRVIDAGEFADERYLANPSNRCFFCKSNLYGALSSLSKAQLFSGTNTDDLGDWRPGLKAAEANSVRHPFVEAGMSKADVRAMAAAHGLNDLAELASAPCLSSRIETALRIEPQVLRAVDQVEMLVRRELSPDTVRCRVRQTGIVVELDETTLSRLSDADRVELARKIADAFDGPPPIHFQAYVRGSAFLREQSA